MISSTTSNPPPPAATLLPAPENREAPLSLAGRGTKAGAAGAKAGRAAGLLRWATHSWQMTAPSGVVVRWLIVNDPPHPSQKSRSGGGGGGTAAAAGAPPGSGGRGGSGGSAADGWSGVQTGSGCADGAVPDSCASQHALQ